VIRQLVIQVQRVIAAIIADHVMETTLVSLVLQFPMKVVQEVILAFQQVGIPYQQ